MNLYRSACSPALIGTIALGLATSAFAPASAQDYSLSVIARGLHRPAGIAIQGSGTLYFTELPTPGVPGSMGGSNAVRRLDLGSGKIDTLHMGEPEPVNLALTKNNTLYWTCRSAGVILEQTPSGITTAFLTGLDHPNGIAIDRKGLVYFTLVPTPGVGGAMGGMNSVNVADGQAIVPLSLGEPEPSDVAVSPDGDLYWTCRSAGVILVQRRGGATRLLLRGLNHPTGIALDHRGQNLYWTEVPTPGVSGGQGGANQVLAMDLAAGMVSVVNAGDPEPTDIAVARNGNLYWTCTSAGVILEARRWQGR